MQKFVRTSRIFTLFVIMTILTVVYVISLYNLQLLREERDIETINTTSYTTTLSAARGDILDRNGILLATSRAVYNLAIARDALIQVPCLSLASKSARISSRLLPVLIS